MRERGGNVSFMNICGMSYNKFLMPLCNYNVTMHKFHFVACVAKLAYV